MAGYGYGRFSPAREDATGLSTGRCPHCKSTEIRWKEGGRSGTYYDQVGVGRMIRYVCLGCGFLEDYAIEKEALEKIRREWSSLDEMQ